MKLLVTSAVLCLLASAPVYAHQEQDNKPQQQEDKPKQQQGDKARQQQGDKPQEQQQEPKKPDEQKKPEPNRQQPREQQPKDQSSRDRQKSDEKQQSQGRQENQRQTEQRQGRQENQRQVQQSQRDTGDRGGRRIPEDRFRSNFGREHRFHIQRSDDRRFQYGGYAFEYTQGWPSVWSYGDDLYIEEIDGQYYLCDYEHPEVRVIVILVD